MKSEKQAKNKFIILVLRYLTIISFFFAITIGVYYYNKPSSTNAVSNPVTLDNKPRQSHLNWASIGVKNIECPEYVNLDIVFESIKNKTIFEHPCLIVYQK